MQGAHVGGHADVDFLDGKLRIDRRITHVAGRDQIDRAAQAITLNGRQHRLAAIVHSVEGGLQFENLAPQLLRVAPNIRTQLAADRSQHHQVDARGKVFASTGDHHRTHFIGVIDPAENVDDLAPEVGVHRIDLFRAVDHHMGNLICQHDIKGFVVGHGSHPQQGRKRKMEIFLC